MRFVQVTFITSSLALAGLPVMNGFWSKELVLEAGWAAGPVWAYVIMLLGVGITALYTLRMTWLVFFGEPRHEKELHPAPTAMRISLGLLAAGNLSTWLVAGPLNRLLETTLPFHHLHIWSTGGLAAELLRAPTTYTTLLVAALGLAVYIARDRLEGVRKLLERPSTPIRHEFGFEKLNHWISDGTQGAAQLLSRTQTGQLNWNLVGILSSLVLLLIILAWSN